MLVVEVAAGVLIALFIIAALATKDERW